VRVHPAIFLVCGILAAAAPPATLGQSTRPAAPAPDGLNRPNEVRGDEITARQLEAVERGLAWLARRQGKEGQFGGDGNYSARSAITSLAALAFMSAGNLPGRGKYGDNVQRCVDYILSSAQQSGLLSADSSHGVMYSHGFATLFLAEVYGMTGDDVVKEKLQKAVRLIELCQNREGGWRYNPVPADADISVTICQVMALRAARDAGIKVDKDVIDKAIRYVRNCQNADGGFSYQANFVGSGGSGFERSAAGVAALYYAGVFEGNDVQRGLEYIYRYLPGRGMGGRSISHYYYGHYYAVQAMFLAGGKYWSDWYPAIRNELLARQDRAGNWSGEVSDDYGTAVALIVLQMPNRYLPVFHGKGPGS
jgi:prenyltransferase beta subunit